MDLRFRRKYKVPIFASTEKIFFGKVGKKSEHQGRSKICLRIEWKHSQPLKSSLGRAHSLAGRFFLQKKICVCVESGYIPEVLAIVFEYIMGP